MSENASLIPQKIWIRRPDLPRGGFWRIQFVHPDTGEIKEKHEYEVMPRSLVNRLSSSQQLKKEQFQRLGKEGFQIIASKLCEFAANPKATLDDFEKILGGNAIHNNDFARAWRMELKWLKEQEPEKYQKVSSSDVAKKINEVLSKPKSNDNDSEISKFWKELLQKSAESSEPRTLPIKPGYVPKIMEIRSPKVEGGVYRAVRWHKLDDIASTQDLHKKTIPELQQAKQQLQGEVERIFTSWRNYFNQQPQDSSQLKGYYDQITSWWHQLYDKIVVVEREVLEKVKPDAQIQVNHSLRHIPGFEDILRELMILYPGRILQILVREVDETAKQDVLGKIQTSGYNTESAMTLSWVDEAEKIIYLNEEFVRQLEEEYSLFNTLRQEIYHQLGHILFYDMIETPFENKKKELVNNQEELKATPEYSKMDNWVSIMHWTRNHQSDIPWVRPYALTSIQEFFSDMFVVYQSRWRLLPPPPQSAIASGIYSQMVSLFTANADEKAL